MGVFVALSLSKLLWWMMHISKHDSRVDHNLVLGKCEIYWSCPMGNEKQSNDLVCMFIELGLLDFVMAFLILLKASKDFLKHFKAYVFKTMYI